MSENVNRYRVEEDAPRQIPVASATVIKIGDLCYLDTLGNVKPAADFTWDTNLATTQTAFALAFIGVAESQSKALETDAVRVGTKGVWEMPCASATFRVFDALGPAKAAGNALESQKVVKVDVAAYSIGVTYMAYASAATNVYMDIKRGLALQAPTTTTTTTTTTAA